MRNRLAFPKECPTFRNGLLTCAFIHDSYFPGMYGLAGVIRQTTRIELLHKEPNTTRLYTVKLGVGVYRTAFLILQGLE